MKRTMVVLGYVCVLSVSACKKADDGDEPIPVDTTPVQHSAISPKPPKGCGGVVLSIHYDDAYKTLREAEEYKPGLRDYYVRELNDRRNIYLNASLSPSVRKEWLGRWPEKDQACLTPLLDEIAAAARRTLPRYRPRGYSQHDSSEEKLIKKAVQVEVPGAEVLLVGVQSEGWKIDKHSNGVPSSRYKYGMAWVKSPSFDDGYCRIAYVNIVGDYAGGNSYADSQANFIKLEPAGCK
jgi:hypothetical protein